MLNNEWYMWPLFCIVATFMVWFAFRAASRNTPWLDRYKSVLILMAGVYGMGVILKAMLIGPDFVRWYMADVGFPMAIVVVVSLIFEPIIIQCNRGADLGPARALYASMRLAERMAPVAVIMSYAYELFAEFATRQIEGPRVNVGGFDWVDIACYTAGGILVYVFVRHNRLLLGAEIKAYDDAAAEAAEARQKSRSRRASRSKQRKRR